MLVVCINFDLYMIVFFIFFLIFVNLLYFLFCFVLRAVYHIFHNVNKLQICKFIAQKRGPNTIPGERVGGDREKRENQFDFLEIV